MRIAIVGAGIGGLAAAVGLQSAGAAVTVFEKAPDVRAGGSGLSLFANGRRALESLGLAPAFEAVTDRGVEGFAAGQRLADGRWIAQVPPTSVGQLRIVDRADLHRILLAPLHPDAVLPDTEVTAASPDGALTFDGGQTARFDLIIGADGLHSRVRAVIDDEVMPHYAGYSAWRGITSVPVDLAGEAGESIGAGRRFGIAPLADGRVYWFAVSNMPEEAVFADEKATVAQLFSGWHSPVAELIEATPASAIHRGPIAELSRRLPRYCCGRVVVLGDAAHAMTPNLGQGGGQALEDAATLTALLSPLIAGAPEATGLEQALARYDRLRRRRTQSIARKSRVLGAVFQLESRLLAGARDAVFSALPSRLIAAQAASVQSWAPPQR